MLGTHVLIVPDTLTPTEARALSKVADAALAATRDWRMTDDNRSGGK